jgi:hypothetical protein
MVNVDATNRSSATESRTQRTDATNAVHSTAGTAGVAAQMDIAVGELLNLA